MKAATTFGVLLALLPTPAFAHYCERPRKPVVSIFLPKEDLLPTITEVESYLGRMEEYVGCLRAEQDDALWEAKQIIRDLALIEASDSYGPP